MQRLNPRDERGERIRLSGQVLFDARNTSVVECEYALRAAISGYQDVWQRQLRHSV